MNYQLEDASRQVVDEAHAANGQTQGQVVVNLPQLPLNPFGNLTHSFGRMGLTWWVDWGLL
jgi:hypothetical protein